MTRGPARIAVHAAVALLCTVTASQLAQQMGDVVMAQPPRMTITVAIWAGLVYLQWRITVRLARRVPRIPVRRSLVVSQDSEESKEAVLESVARARSTDPANREEVARIKTDLERSWQPVEDLAAHLPVRSVHEAGHAVAAIALGGTMQSASVLRVGDQGGHVNYFMPLDRNLLDRKWFELCVTVAGMVAERLAGHTTTAGASDQAHAEQVAAALVAARFQIPSGEVRADGLTIGVLVAAAASEAEQVLRAHRDALSAIATLLCESESHGRTLRDPDLRMVFDRVEIR